MRHRVRRRVAAALGRAALVLLVLTILPASSRATETVILKLIVNSMDFGEQFIMMTGEGVILITPEDLLEIGLKRLPERAKGAEVSVEGTDYIPLYALAPEVTYELDEREAVLNITVAPGLFRKNVVDLSRKETSPAERTHNNSAFINYSLYYNMDDDFNFTSLSLPLEAGANIGGVLGLSTFSYTKNDTEDNLARLMTSVTVDDPGRQRRYVFGDVSAASGVLGGVGVSKNFSLTPFFVTSPVLTLKGVLETPSDVELYVDERLVETLHLGPGEFELTNITEATGRGNATLVIKDAFGRETRITRPFYISTSLLKPGLHEYSYNLGFRREGLGTEDFEYGGLAFSGFHRLGITESFTGRLSADADKETISLVSDAGFTLGGLGEATASASARRTLGRYGYSGSLGYSFGAKGIGGGLSISGFTKDFSYTATGASASAPHISGSLGLSYNVEMLGSFSASYSFTKKWIGTDTATTSLIYSKRLFDKASLFVRASRTRAGTKTDTVFAGLNFILGKERSGGLGYTVQDSGSSQNAYFSKNAPAGTGSGYRLSVDRNEDSSGTETYSSNASGIYRGRYGRYSADVRRSGEKNSYSLSASGALGFIGSSVHASRPINDAFALVKVGNVKGVRVSSNNQVVGRTNRNGEVFVPNLTSYYDNSLSIDDTDIPVNYEITDVSRRVSTPLRGGGVVGFKVKKLQAFLGSFAVVEKGEAKKAEYWGFEIRPEEETTTIIVGRDGEFYLENIPAGTWPARLFLKDKECRFDMTIPESEEMMVDMEEVRCEMD